MAATSLGSLNKAVATPAQNFRVITTSATVTGTAAIATGLTKIQAAMVTVTNAATSVPTGLSVASIASISGGTINAVVYNFVTGTASISAAGITVQVVAIGD